MSSVERLSLKELMALRRQFARSNAGKWAFRTIVSGVECVAKNSEGSHCGQQAVGTIDADILGGLDLFPFCSEEHSRKIRQALEKETSSVVGRNGWGRA